MSYLQPPIPSRNLDVESQNTGLQHLPPILHLSLAAYVCWLPSPGKCYDDPTPTRADDSQIIPILHPIYELSSSSSSSSF
ncbi:hypothetical protein Pdw03_4266 [Penicillium digitatum]|uniref:Uncharacterized protein n=1 Tax=Penicillium digitatum TaxID=36651 RepID=A0A7T6XHX9_PENDI|nr:hypothetical protein Pdw03_4266 [Penicillium digitatum]